MIHGSTKRSDDLPAKTKLGLLKALKRAVRYDLNLEFDALEELQFAGLTTLVSSRRRVLDVIEELAKRGCKDDAERLQLRVALRMWQKLATAYVRRFHETQQASGVLNGR